MLGYYRRPEKVENLIEKFGKQMDRDEYKDAKETLVQLIDILGDNHPEVIALRTEYEIEAEE